MEKIQVQRGRRMVEVCMKSMHVQWPWLWLDAGLGILCPFLIHSLMLCRELECIGEPLMEIPTIKGSDI